jgi:phosphoserine phosphatase
VKKKLIAIDVEGVIIPKAMYLIKIFLRYRPGKLLNVLWAGSLYSLGLIPIDRALVEIFRHLERLEEEKLLIIIRDIDLKPGVVELFEEIRDRGHKIVLITSGIPQQALDLIASSLKVDHAVGPHVIIKDGRVTGQVTGALVEEGGKSEVLRLIIEENNLEDYSIVSIADDKNNITLFKMSDLSIGYRPDFMLTLYSDRIKSGL